MPHVLGKLSSCKLPAQVGKVQVASNLPAQVGKLQVASMLPAQVGKLPACCKVKLADRLSASADSSCQLRLAGCRLTSSCQLKLASCPVKLEGKLQVARSSWQVSACSSCPVKLEGKLQVQVGRQVAGKCWLKLPASWQVSSCQQVGRQDAGSSWQVSRSS